MHRGRQDKTMNLYGRVIWTTSRPVVNAAIIGCGDGGFGVDDNGDASSASTSADDDGAATEAGGTPVASGPADGASTSDESPTEGGADESTGTVGPQVADPPY